MPGPYDPYREPEDIGAESPARGSAKQQAISGARGGPRQAKQRGKTKQPAQDSGRRAARHLQRPVEAKSFRREEDPDEQGTGEPHPDRLRTRSALQGIGSRSGSHAAHGERTEELGQQGPPDHGHTRHGRQRVPGQPERPIPPGDSPDEHT